jgi:two-component system alkaline phosphatase synthesis response regulator PhoP
MSNLILIVEDEIILAQSLCEYLISKGFQCHHEKDIQGATEFIEKMRPPVCLLDIGLPDGSGLDLARTIRKVMPNSVILFLSAQNSPEIRVAGLEIGAHDFITKPFELEELRIRLERILRSKQDISELPKEIYWGKLGVFFDSYELYDAKNRKIPLSQKECSILKLLFINKNEVVSRDQIIDEVWGINSFPSNRTVDNYIVKLRKWSESDDAGIVGIETIRGIGYKLSIKEK